MLPKLAGHGMRLLEIENLHVEIDGKKILKVVDLGVNAGEVHAIIGPNGSAEVDILAQAPAQEIFT
jgi:Fe-S cluster assembly ATP-binding protein